MPLYSCAVESVLWESCPVTRSPSCASLHRQTAKPLPPSTCVVSSPTYLFCWTDGPSRLQAAPTPRSCDRSKDKRTKQMSVLKTAIWDDMAVIFTVYQAPRKHAKKKTQKLKSNGIFLRSHNSVGYEVRSSGPSAGKNLASPHARDDVEPRPPLRTSSCNKLGKHQKSTTNKQ